MFFVAEAVAIPNKVFGLIVSGNAQPDPRETDGLFGRASPGPGNPADGESYISGQGTSDTAGHLGDHFFTDRAVLLQRFPFYAQQAHLRFVSISDDTAHIICR